MRRKLTVRTVSYVEVSSFYGIQKIAVIFLQRRMTKTRIVSVAHKDCAKTNYHHAIYEYIVAIADDYSHEVL